MNCRTLPQKLGYEWPNLKDFFWVHTCPVGSRPHGPTHARPANGGPPRLENLFPKEGQVADGSERCYITDDVKAKRSPRHRVSHESSDFIDFFWRNTTPESLKLNDLSVSRSSLSKQEEPVELPHLTRLSVHNATFGYVLSLLNLPPLK